MVNKFSSHLSWWTIQASKGVFLTGGGEVSVMEAASNIPERNSAHSTRCLCITSVRFGINGLQRGLDTHMQEHRHTRTDTKSTTTTPPGMIHNPGQQSTSILNTLYIYILVTLRGKLSTAAWHFVKTCCRSVKTSLIAAKQNAVWVQAFRESRAGAFQLCMEDCLDEFFIFACQITKHMPRHPHTCMHACLLTCTRGRKMPPSSDEFMQIRKMQIVLVRLSCPLMHFEENTTEWRERTMNLFALISTDRNTA